jgi:hypothetical protein
MTPFSFHSSVSRLSERPSSHYDACARRFMHGPIQPMETPGLIQRLIGLRR